MNNQAKQFEDLCAALLQSLGHTVAREVAVGRFRLDLVIRRNDTIEKVIEVKLVRENPGTLATLRDVISRAKSLLAGHSFGSDKQLLILSCSVADEHKAWLSKEFRLAIWDRNEILIQATKSRGLQNQLAAFFKEVDEVTSLVRIREATSSSLDIDASSPLATEEPLGHPRDLRGTELCQQLADTPRGRQGAKRYETLIIDVLQYLFGDYLLDQRAQSRLEDRLSILDVVYRVGQGHPFWDTLTRDFRARVMVFECKNYSKPIMPNQLHTTERYISASALRPVCFLVTRFKPHKHTELAAFGAMREKVESSSSS